MLRNMSDPGTFSWLPPRTDPRGRTYVVGVQWERNGAVLVPVELRVRCKGGVDATVLRAVPTAEVIAQARAGQVKLLRKASQWPDLPAADRQRAAELLDAERRPEDDLAVLEVVAATYRAASRAPAKAVHEELVRRGVEVSRPQAGKLIMRCRQLGLLGPAEPRRAGERVEIPRKGKG